MNLDEAIAATAPDVPAVPMRRVAGVRADDGPGSYSWDGSAGVITTPVVGSRPTSWDEYVRDAGLDPALVEVVEPVQVRGWDANAGNGEVIRLHYYRLTVRTRANRVDLGGLTRRILAKRPRKPLNLLDGSTYFVAPGDLQAGKLDGDGPEGMFDRMGDALAASVVQLRRLRQGGLGAATVFIPWMADCSEGYVSQEGTNSWRTVLTQTEQQTVVRTLMYRAVELFAPLTERLIVAAIPGNHDQAVRIGGRGVTRYDDSQDVDALRAVLEGLRLNPAAFGHVEGYLPGRDELTVTLTLSDTVVGLAHGHMWRPGKALEWWSDQAFGDQPIGRADVLISGHYHHFLHTVPTLGRTWLQVPAMESESTWFRHRQGKVGAPGLVTGVIAGGKLHHVHVV